jgi:hypothetical protein
MLIDRFWYRRLADLIVIDLDQATQQNTHLEINKKNEEIPGNIGSKLFA